MPGVGAALREAAHAGVRAATVPRGREVLLPRRRHLDPCVVEHPRDVGEAVRLAVDLELEQRPAPERIAETAAPAVAVQQRLEEVRSMLATKVVERPDEARRDVLPDEDRARHVHVGGVVAVQQVVDAVREVEVARDDRDVEPDAGRLLELAAWRSTLAT